MNYINGFIGLMVFMSALAIVTFQIELRRQTNWWRMLVIPKVWNLQATLLFGLMLMLEVVGMSFICLMLSNIN